MVVWLYSGNRMSIGLYPDIGMLLSVLNNQYHEFVLVADNQRKVIEFHYFRKLQLYRNVWGKESIKGYDFLEFVNVSITHDVLCTDKNHMYAF